MISQGAPFGVPSLRNRRSIRGFSLVEALVVVAIAGILAAIAIPNYAGQIRDHKLIEYSGQVEYLAKYARMYAMEKTTNVGVCINGSNVSLRDITTNRSATPCSGTQIMNVAVDSSLSVSGTGAAIDPRGLVIGGIGGVCVANGTKHRTVRIEMTGTLIEEGNGGCS